MALKITKASDPIKVERLNVCIYGQPGIGKTSLAFTAASPLLLDFDNGARRAANRRDSVAVNSWADVLSINSEDLAGYSTVIIDTAGRALDHLTTDIIRKDAKAGSGGALSLKGYGTLKAQFGAWLKALNSHGKDIVLVAHMDEQRSGDDIIERLDVQGGSKGEIYKSVDAMGRIMMRDGKRVLNFSPTDAAFGKNPGQLAPIEIPHPDRMADFLADIIQSIKDKLNAMSEEQVAAQQAMQAWRDRIEGFESAADFNASLADVKAAPKAIQAVFAEAARAHGLTFDAKAKAYTEPQQAAA